MNPIANAMTFTVYDAPRPACSVALGLAPHALLLGDSKSTLYYFTVLVVLATGSRLET